MTTLIIILSVIILISLIAVRTINKYIYRTQLYNKRAIRHGFSKNFITAYINTKNNNTIEESCNKLVSNIKSNTAIENFIKLSNKIVIIVIGSNGSGKTTTCFKIAKHENTNHTPIICTTDSFKASNEYFYMTAKANNIPYLKNDVVGKSQKFYADYYINQFTSSCHSMLIIDTAGINFKKTNLTNEVGALCNCVRIKCMTNNISVITIFTINARNHPDIPDSIISDVDCLAINHIGRPINEHIFNLLSDIGKQYTILFINHNNNINDLTLFNRQMLKVDLYNTLIKIH